MMNMKSNKKFVKLKNFGDGSVNVLDVIMLANRIAGGTQADPETEDINGDGLVNVLDVINLANQISTGE